jgi:hypothetical protein
MLGRRRLCTRRPCQPGVTIQALQDSPIPVFRVRKRENENHYSAGNRQALGRSVASACDLSSVPRSGLSPQKRFWRFCLVGLGPGSGEDMNRVGQERRPRSAGRGRSHSGKGIGRRCLTAASDGARPGEVGYPKSWFREAQWAARLPAAPPGTQCAGRRRVGAPVISRDSPVRCRRRCNSTDVDMQRLRRGPVRVVGPVAFRADIADPGEDLCLPFAQRLHICLIYMVGRIMRSKSEVLRRLEISTGKPSCPRPWPTPG